MTNKSNLQKLRGIIIITVVIPFILFSWSYSIVMIVQYREWAFLPAAIIFPITMLNLIKNNTKER